MRRDHEMASKRDGLRDALGAQDRNARSAQRKIRLRKKGSRHTDRTLLLRLLPQLRLCYQHLALAVGSKERRYGSKQEASHRPDQGGLHWRLQ